MMIILYFISLLLSYPSSYLSAISFSPKGNWTISKNPEKECVHEFLCSWNNLTWYADRVTYDYSHLLDIKPQTAPSGPGNREYDGPFVIFNSTTGCDALLRRGIRKISFHGDSYMRQMYTGMLLLLSGGFLVKDYMLWIFVIDLMYLLCRKLS
jgi:hypothetical protein